MTHDRLTLKEAPTTHCHFLSGRGSGRHLSCWQSQLKAERPAVRRRLALSEPGALLFD